MNPWEIYQQGQGQSQSQPPQQQPPAQPSATAGPWTQYQGQPWSQVLERGLGNLPQDILDTGQAFLEPFAHPIDAIQNAIKLGIGTGQHIAGREGEPTPEMQKASAVKQHFGQYTTLEGIKEALAAHPAGTIADASAVLSGGETLLGRAPGLIGTAARATRYVNPATAVENVLGKVVSPVRTNPDVAPHAANLEREGIPLTAGERTGSKRLRYLEHQIGGSHGEEYRTEQAGKFTEAAMKKAGSTANRAGPDELGKAFDDVGAEFDRLEAAHQVAPDQQLLGDLRNVGNDYANLTGSSAKPYIAKTIQNIQKTFSLHGPQGSPNLSGEAFKAKTSELSRLARNSSDPEYKAALLGIKEALDNAMERTLAAKGSPDLGAWREARNRYRNLKTIETAALTTGEKAAQGFVSPSSLRNAVVRKQGGHNYATGRGDLAELARSGEAVLKPPPTSGTSERLGAEGAALVLPGLAATALTGGDLASAMLGLTVGGGVRAVEGAALMSKPVQAWLGNQLSKHTKPYTDAMVRALNAQRAVNNKDTKERQDRIARALLKK